MQSASFDGPSVFSISPLNLTIKERNARRGATRRDAARVGHLPYGWRAAPYLGSAKRGAGLPFPVASFLCALDPVTMKKRILHYRTILFPFSSLRCPIKRRKATKNFLNREKRRSPVPSRLSRASLLPRTGVRRWKIGKSIYSRDIEVPRASLRFDSPTELREIESTGRPSATESRRVQ